MCSQEGTANVYKEIMEAKARTLKELRERKVLTDKAIVTLERSLAEYTARLKEIESDDKRH